MPKVYRSPAARRDLVEHFDYLEERAGLGVAESFLRNAEASFNDLAQQPAMGAPLTLKHADLAGVRKWRVRDFEDYLIFHMPRPDGIFIMRVLHGASDWWNLLGMV